jgi:hypothetical protein
MLAYRENNIIFRIASADAISKFKEVQSHSFIQVNRKEFDFDTKSKEALLLEYDRFSQLIMKIERLMLMDDVHELSQPLRNFILQALVDEFNSVEEICATHRTVFSPDITTFLSMIHRYSRCICTDWAKAVLQLGGEKAFPALTIMLSDYLQHTLCALHEYDTNIIKRNQPILSYSAFSRDAAGMELVPIVERANFFLRQEVEPNFELKNYVNAQVDSRVCSRLLKLGVKLQLADNGNSLG